MADEKSKKKIKGFKNFDPKKYVDVTPAIDEPKGQTNEAIMRNAAVISFGRMNPITVGHEKLATKVASEAIKRKGDPLIFLSHSSDAKKNPLSYDDKIKFATKAFGSIVKKSPAKTIIEIAKSLSGKYKNLVFIAGQDRVNEFEALLNKYNGKEYNFQSIEVVSAGARDPDSEGVEGMSASKMRDLARDADLKTFTSGLPRKIKANSKEIYDAVRRGMNMTEEVEIVDEALNRAQRIKRSRAMKKARFKIKRGRDRASRKTASMDVLKKRARKAAIAIIKKKFTKGRNYDDLSPGEKEIIDKRLEKISPRRIEAIARKMLPKVRELARDRLASKAGVKKEDLDINTKFENFIIEASHADTRVLKRPHMLMDKNNKTKFDARFKMFKKKAVNESFEDLVEDLATLVLNTENYIDTLDEAGLWDNIHAKRKRIKNGSGERMRKPGSKGAPTDDDFKSASESVNEMFDKVHPTLKKELGSHGDHAIGMAGSDKGVAVSFDRAKDIDALKKQMAQHGYKNVTKIHDTSGKHKHTYHFNEATFKVDIEGLPAMFVDAESAPQVKKTLRQMLKKPDDMIKDIARVQPAEVKKHFRLKALGKDEEQMDEEAGAGEEGTDKLVKKLKKDTPTNSVVSKWIKSQKAES